MKWIYRILVLAAIVGAALWLKHQFFPANKTVEVSTIATIRDTVWQDSIIYREIEPTSPDTIVRIDSVEVPPDTVIKYEYVDLYKQYYSDYYYVDTLRDDSSMLFVLDQTISENRPTNMAWYAKNRRPTKIIEEKTVREVYSRNQFYIGGEFGSRTAQPSVMYKTKNGMIYKAGYDLREPVGVRVGLYMSLDKVGRVIVGN